MSLRNSWSARFVAVAAPLVVVAALESTASAQYPSPTPDFSHPGTAPHHALMTPASGTDSRPLLVIRAVYSNASETSTANAATRFFGTARGSIAHYYGSESFGRFTVTPASESEGTANDGVIRASIGATSDILTDGTPAGLGPRFGRQAVQAANKTNTWIDFASFDTNRDTVVDERELLIVVLTDTGDGSWCGGTRSIAPTSVDGITLAGRQYSFDFGPENQITHAHELAHQAFATGDQAYTAGPYDITSVTCHPVGWPATQTWEPYFSFNSWHKLHLGWATPDVVTKDGYQYVPAWESSGRSFLLYDPARGTDDYLLVENRRPGVYDQDVAASSLGADSGLLIWRIDDRAYGAQDARRLYDLVRPSGSQTSQNYSGGSADAWDPTDPSTPQRRVSPAWADGSPSKLAVRAIGRRDASMLAYFDVRGPGVLVDTFALDRGDDAALATIPRLLPGEQNAIAFPVMNTGEQTGSFEFTAYDLPSGWTSTTHTMTLAAGQAADATLQVTPPLGARADGLYELRVIGRASDGSVSSNQSFRAYVLPKLGIDDVAVTEGDSGTQDASLTVSLSEAAHDSVSVDVATVAQTASEPSDFDALITTLTFAPGQTSKTVTVPIRGDTQPEGDESLLVRLSNARGAKIVDAEGTITVRTDPEPLIAIDDVRVVEDDTAARFTVSLSEPNNTAVAVQVVETRDGTATAPADYAATTGRIDIPVGATAAMFAVPIREDVIDEIDEETFTVRLSMELGAVIGSRSIGTGTIRDDDRDGSFACRAAGIRIGDDEAGVANAPRVPCRDSGAVGLPIKVSSGLLTVTVSGGIAATDQTPDDLTGTAPMSGDRATAHAEATSIVVRAGLNVLRLDGFTSDAKAECVGSGPPRLTSNSRVTLLSLNGQPAVTATAQTTIPLALATLRLNQTVIGPTGVVQRALVLDNALGADIVLGEAQAGFAGTAAHPGGHPCTA